MGKLITSQLAKDQLHFMEFEGDVNIDEIIRFRDVADDQAMDRKMNERHNEIENIGDVMDDFFKYLGETFNPNKNKNGN